MQIAKGIQGIRRFLKDNREGWHIFIDGQYSEYLPATVSEVFGIMAERQYAVYTFTGWMGNTLQFTTVGE